MPYFDSYPQGEYANTRVVDITRRVVLKKAIVGDKRVYLPYEVSGGERADQVGQDYYGDSDHTWMVYMSAGIIDPYHEWYLDQNSFEEHIKVKYGSYERAVERTHCWELNWSSDLNEMSVAGYEALEPELKKYWTAVYGEGSRILSYERKPEGWTASTNMVVRLEITPSSNVAFAAGDHLTVYTGPTRDGTAEVAWANSSVIKVIHVQANVAIGQVVKTDAGANATVSDIEYVSNTIPLDERPYWSRVSKYDWEYGRNESRKHVRLVDRTYAQQMTMELRKKLAEI